MNPTTPGKTVFELVNNEYIEWEIVDVVFTTEEPHAILECDTERATVPVAILEDALTDRDDEQWVPSMYNGEHGSTEWIPHPEHTADSIEPDCDRQQFRIAPTNPSDLTLKLITDTGSLTKVNQFLDGEDKDGLVFHRLGSVSTWKACFVACYDTAIVSVAVLHHYHPSTNGEEIAITRLANHESAPHNTSSWMIANVRKWAERSGYERIAAYAGVDDNGGTCYRAAGFELDGTPDERTGVHWEETETQPTEQTWTRQKFVDDLTPSKYSEKSEHWAIESVVDEVVSPTENTVTFDTLLDIHDGDHAKSRNMIGEQVTF